MSKINLHNYEAFLLDLAEGRLSGEGLAELKAFAALNPQLDIVLEDEALPYLEEEYIKPDFKNQLYKNQEAIEDEELLNYLENNLNEKERLDVEQKLAGDKNLADKLADYRKTILVSDEELVFNNKQNLVKTEEAWVLNNKAIACLEGDLSAAERKDFEAELKSDKALLASYKLVTQTVLHPDLSLVYPDKKGLKKGARVLYLFNYKTMVSIAAAVVLLVGMFVLFQYNPNPLKPFSGAIAVKPGSGKAVKLAAPSVIDSGSNKPQEPEIKELALTVKNQGKNEPVIRTKKETGFPVTVTDTVSIKKLVINEDTLSLPNTSILQNESQRLVKENTQRPGISPQPGMEPLSAGVQANENYQTLSQLSVVSDEDEEQSSAPAKKGFWQRAVKAAKRANTLGIKSIDGEKSENDSYLLSFNSFSIEKK